MKKTILAGFILIALSLSFSIAQANFSVLYDWIWGPKEEIKQEAEDPTVGFVYNPVYFKKIGNDIQLVNSSWGFISGNTTSTNATTTGSFYVTNDFAVGGEFSLTDLSFTNGTGTNLYIGDDLTVDGNGTITGYASSTSGLNTQGTLHIGGNGTVEGIFTLPALGTAAGSFAAYNAAGDLISTTTPAGGGSSTFIDLTDTPASFTDNGSKFVKVNAAEDALEFVDSGLFEIDVSGGLQPVTDNLTDNYYELDVNDDIQPLIAP